MISYFQTSTTSSFLGTFFTSGIKFDAAVNRYRRVLSAAQGETSSGVFSVRYNVYDQPLSLVTSGTVSSTANGATVKVCCNPLNDGWVVVFGHNGAIYGRRITSAGALTDGSDQLLVSGTTNVLLDVGCDDLGRFTLLYYKTPPGSFGATTTDVFLKRFTSTLAVSIAETQINIAGGKDPTRGCLVVHPQSGRISTIHTEFVSAAVSTGRIRVYDSSGSFLAGATTQDNVREPASLPGLGVAMTALYGSDNFLVAYLNTSSRTKVEQYDSSTSRLYSSQLGNFTSLATSIEYAVAPFVTSPPCQDALIKLESALHHRISSHNPPVLKLDVYDSIPTHLFSFLSVGPTIPVGYSRFWHIGASQATPTDTFLECFESRPSNTITLRDRTDNSSTISNEDIVNVVLSEPTTCGEEAYFFSDSQTTTPTSTDPRFLTISTTLTSAVFQFQAGNGTRTAYLWLRDIEGRINTVAIADSIQLTTLNFQTTAIINESCNKSVRPLSDQILLRTAIISTAIPETSNLNKIDSNESAQRSYYFLQGLPTTNSVTVDDFRLRAFDQHSIPVTTEVTLSATTARSLPAIVVQPQGTIIVARWEEIGSNPFGWDPDAAHLIFRRYDSNGTLLATNQSFSSSGLDVSRKAVVDFDILAKGSTNEGHALFGFKYRSDAGSIALGTAFVGADLLSTPITDFSAGPFPANNIYPPLILHDSEENLIYDIRYDGSGGRSWKFIKRNSGGTRIGGTGSSHLAFVGLDRTPTTSNTYFRSGAIAFQKYATRHFFIISQQENLDGITFTVHITRFYIDSPASSNTDGTVISYKCPLITDAVIGVHEVSSAVGLTDGRIIFSLTKLTAGGASKLYTVETSNDEKLILNDIPNDVIVDEFSFGGPGYVSLSRHGRRIYALQTSLDGSSTSKVNLQAFWDSNEGIPSYSLNLGNRHGNRSEATYADNIVNTYCGDSTVPSAVLSETITTKPSTGFVGFPSTFALSSGQGIKTVYAWFRHVNDTILPHFSTIYLSNSTQPAPSNILSVSDRTSESSSLVTRSRTVSVFYNGIDSDIFGFLSESQTIAPSSSDSRFVAIKSCEIETTFVLSNTPGNHRIYLWLKNVSNNLVSSVITTSIVLDLSSSSGSLLEASGPDLILSRSSTSFGRLEIQASRQNDGTAVFLAENSDGDITYQILDGRGFPKTSSFTHSKTGTIWSRPHITILSNGNFISSRIEEPNFVTRLFDGITGSLISQTTTLATETFSSDFHLQHTVARDSNADRTLSIWRTSNATLPTLSRLIVTQANTAKLFGTGSIWGTTSTYQVGFPTAWNEPFQLFAVMAGKGGRTLGKNFEALGGSTGGAGPSDPEEIGMSSKFSTLRYGAVAIAKDTITDGYIVVYQIPTSSVPQRYRIKVYRGRIGSHANDGWNLVSGPSTVYEVTSSTPGKCDEQALEEIVVLADGRYIIPIADLDADSKTNPKTSKLIIMNANDTINRIIDLGVYGDISVAETNNRIFVLYQDITPNSGNIYLKTFIDTGLELPPLAISATPAGNGQLSLTNRVVTLSFNSPDFASAYFVSDTQTTRPDINNVQFVSTFPATFAVSLGGDPIKKIYAWYRNPTVSFLSNFSTVSFSSPTLAITAVDQYGSTTGTRSEIITIRYDRPFNNTGNLEGARAFLSETQTTSPLTTDVRFSTVTLGETQTRFVLSLVSGPHTIYMWIKNNLEYLNQSDIVDSIDFDTSSITLLLRDRTSGSEALTNEQIISTSRIDATGVTWLLTESTSIPATTSPSFSGTFPSTFQISSGDGRKTVYLWSKNASQSMLSTSDTITLDSVANATFALSISDRSSGSQTFTNERVVCSSIGLSGSGSELSSMTWILTESSTAPSEFNPGFSTSVPQTFELSAGNGTKNVWLWAKDTAGNFLVSKDSISLSLGSVDATISLALFDRTSGSTTISNEEIISTTISGSGTEFATLQFILNESSTPPSTTDPAFSSTAPTTFDLSSSNGTKTVFLWAKNNTGNLISTSDTIFLDSFVNATIFLSLTDRLSGSASVSSQEVVSSAISGSGPEFASLRWLLTETQGTPNINDPQFSLTAPVTFDLSTGNGVKTVYLWAKDTGNNLISTSDTITLDASVEASIFLTVLDRTSGSTSHTNEEIISAIITGVGPEAPTLLWLLNEVATTPSTTDPGFSSTIPTTFDLSSSDGIKTVYLWAKDISGNIISTSKIITLDTVNDAVVFFNITDRTSGSPELTNAEIISSTITGTGTDFNSLRWLITESTGTPSENDPGFSSVKPSTFDLSSGDGLKTVFVWAKDLAGNMLPSVSDTITLDTLVDATISMSLFDRTSGSESVTNEEVISVDITGSGAEFSSLEWLIRETAGTPSEFDPGFTSVLPSTFDLTSANGLKTVRLWAKDPAGNMLVVTDTITLDNVVSATITISLFDRTSGSGSLTNEEIISTVIGGSGAEFSSLEWLLTESAISPDLNDPGFSATIPATFDLSSGDGTKTVYIWAKDPNENIISSFDSIVLDTQVLATIALSLSDRSSGSTVYTNNEVVSSDISGSGFEFASLQWLLTESTSVPSESDPAFTTTAPTTFDLSSIDGNKTVYLWAKDSAGNLISTNDSIILDTIIDASISLSLSDRTTASQDTTNEQTISADIGGSGGEFGSLVWFLTQDPATPPEFYPGFSPTIPDSFVLDSGNELKTVYLWAKDPAGNLTSTSDTIFLSSGVDASILLEVFDRTSGSTLKTNERIISTSVSGSGPDFSSLEFLINESITPPATNDPLFSVTAPVTFLLSSGDSLKTVVLWAKNTGNNIINDIDLITLDTAIDLSSFLLDARDRTSNSPALTNEEVISIFASVTGADAGSMVTFLTETAGVPSEFDLRFSATLPTTFDLSSGDGLKTIYLWGKDAAGNLVLTTDTITLDTAVDATISIVAKDQTYGSDRYTDSRIVDLTTGVSGPEAASLVFLVNESATAPSEFNPGFSSTIPTTFELSAGDGLKVISLWAKDPAGNIKRAFEKISLFSLDYLLTESSNAPSASNPGFSLTQPVTFGLTGADGLKTVNLWVRTPVGNLFNSFDTISLQTGVLATISLNLRDRTSGSTTHTNEETISTGAAGSGSEFASLQFLINQIATTPLASDPGFSPSLPDDFELSSGDGLKTVYLWAKNPSNNIIGTYDSIILDTVFSATITLSLTDRTSGSLILTNEQIVSSAIGASGLESGSLQYLISEFQPTTPSELDSRFTGTVPVTFNLSAVDGLKQVYLWAKDLAGNIVGTSDSITLDSVLDASISLNLFDRTNGSSSLTDERIVSSNILATGSDAGVLQYLLSEVQSITPSELNPGFSTSPVTFNLSSGDGLKTLYLWVKDPAGNISGTSDSIILNTGGSNTISLALFDTTSGSATYTNERVVSSDIASVGSLEFILSETQTTPPSEFDPGFSVTVPVTFNLTNGDGAKLVYLWAKDIAGNVFGATDSIILDTGVGAAIVLALNDRTSGSDAYTNERTVSSFISAIGAEAGSLEYLLSETQTTTPSEMDSRFSAITPNTFFLTSGDGQKQAYLWAKDPAGNIIGVTDTITLDTIFNGAIVLIVTDRTSGSTTETDSRIVSISETIIGPDAALADCFISETQSTPPSELDLRFSEVPPTIELSPGEGVKTLYVWCRDAAGNIAGTQQSITFNTLDPQIFLRDRFDSSDVSVKEHIISTFFNLDASMPPVSAWFLSETQTTKPSVSNTGFVGTMPVTFRLANVPNPTSGEGQIRTVYAWVRDISIVLHDIPATDTITMGVPPTASIALRDTSTASTSFSTSRTVSVSTVSNSNVRDGGVTGYLISETQTTAPAYNSSGFGTSAPSSFTFAANGVRTAYLWTKNRYYRSESAAISTIFVQADDGQSFTYILRSGSQLITPVLSTSPVMRIAKFMPGSSDVAFFVVKGTSIFDFRARADLPVDPDQSTPANFQLDGGRAYLYNLVLSQPIVTIQINGLPLSS